VKQRRLTEAEERKLRAKLDRIGREGVPGQLDLLDGLLDERALRDQVNRDDTPNNQ